MNEQDSTVNEETPEVEGHIRKAHTMNEGPRVQSPAEALDAATDEDGPDVEGHSLRRF
ncbi:MAG TPA: hypothetical protein VG228_03145 [Solirubrobacteraceae bacterium]|jgi:hypothetical protein|nr:hypothetical protein [Solirubrobacteraceae bacterium]